MHRLWIVRWNLTLRFSPICSGSSCFDWDNDPLPIVEETVQWAFSSWRLSKVLKGEGLVTVLLWDDELGDCSGDFEGWATMIAPITHYAADCIKAEQDSKLRPFSLSRFSSPVGETIKTWNQGKLIMRTEIIGSWRSFRCPPWNETSLDGRSLPFACN
jgi:hypothetical protein